MAKLRAQQVKKNTIYNRIEYAETEQAQQSLLDINEYFQRTWNNNSISQNYQRIKIVPTVRQPLGSAAEKSTQGRIPIKGANKKGKHSRRSTMLLGSEAELVFEDSGSTLMPKKVPKRPNQVIVKSQQ